MFLYRDYLPLRGKIAQDASPAGHAGRAAQTLALRCPTGSLRGAAPAGHRLHPRSEHDAAGVESRARLPGDSTSSSSTRSTSRAVCASGESPTSQGDLGTKQVYDPKIAAEKIGLQAAHFVELVVDTLDAPARDRLLVCSPYDAELFGHWWFEGPLWLEHVAREMERRKAAAHDAWRVARVGAGAHDRVAPGGLVGRRRRPSGVAQPRHRVDLGPHLQRRAEWVEPPQPGYDGRPELKRVMTQASRELLLLQSSDWQFLITTGTAADYAERRVAEHYAEFKRLSEMAHALEAGDPLSPEAARLAAAPRARGLLSSPISTQLGSRGGRREEPNAVGAHVCSAMIMAGGKGDRLHPLTRERSKPAVPFGGRYRIDRLRPVELRQLGDAVALRARAVQVAVADRAPAPGLAHDVACCRTTSSPSCPRRCASAPAWYRGTADAVLQNLNLVDDFNADVVAIFGADHIYRMDVNQMLAFHQESGADVTVAARPVPLAEARAVRRAGRRSRGARGRTSTRSRRTRRRMPGDPERALVSMGNYLFSPPGARRRARWPTRGDRPTTTSAARSSPSWCRRGRVFAYDFQDNEVPGVKPYEEQGYWRDVGTMQAYWDAHMDLLGESPRFDLDNRLLADPHRHARRARRPASSAATSTTRRSASRRWSSARPSATRSWAARCGSTRARSSRTRS